MAGRHRHAVNVRTDGLAAVLGSLANDPRIRAAALVDVDSGMVLDACGPDTSGGGPDTESRGAAHAELVRTALALASGSDGCEVVVHAADGARHVLQPVADPHGDRLALAVVVRGSALMLARLRRRLRAVSAAALTAGPSTALRPTADGWQPGRLQPPAPPHRTAPPPAAPTELAKPVTSAATPLWVAGDHVAGPADPRLPALAGLPPEPPDPLARRTPGSTWTAPPAPSTPVDVERTAPEAEQTGAAVVPGQRRPAPPSALPPGAPHGPAGDDGLGRSRTGPG